MSVGRLRFFFLVLGSVLLGALGALATLAKSRLDEARSQREEMVASRVFDEMEREVSAFLEQENQRPAYTRLDQTNPETWAPFVVGYFSEDRLSSQSHPQIVVAEGPTSEHRRRMNWALSEARDEWMSSIVPPTPSSPSPNEVKEEATSAQPPLLRARQQKSEEAPERPQGNSKLPAPAPTAKKPTSDREIIESLNRAPERRKAAPKPSKEKQRDDPFSDYMESF